MGSSRQYSDEDRATACALLEANGYPQKKGAMNKTSKATGIPPSTLRGWFTEQNNPPPTKLRDEKKIDIAEALKNELAEIFQAMHTTRPEASYRELSTALGIVIEKIALVSGDPTQRLAVTDWRSEAIRMIKNKEVDFEEMVKQFGEHDAELLFEQAGVSIQTG